MTWPAALSVAALRVMRTAAARRALRLGLLVGALFALGFLCGEQAHAADGTPEVSSTGSLASSAADGALSTAQGAVGEVADASATAVTSTGLDSVSHPANSGADAATAEAAAGNAGGLPPVHGSSRTGDTSRTSGSSWTSGSSEKASSSSVDSSDSSGSSDFSERGSAGRAGSSVRTGGSVQGGSAARSVSFEPTGPVLRPVADSVVRSVGERVVRPVGHLAGAVTDELAEARSRVLPSDPLPSLPTLPGSSTLPGLSGPPGESELPVRVPPLPVTSMPGTQRPGAGPSLPSGEHAPDGRTVARTARGAADGPRFTVVGTVPGTAVGAGSFGLLRDLRDGQAPVRQAPVRQAPARDAGALLGPSGLDTGTPRHADVLAVTLIDRAPLRPAPGAAARPDAAGTRDRHRDIPVFPG
ncbi:hypothetical protein [Streptomyces sp. NPDC086766]|uniref:hypothetical protein n=1 Tax=Streptomyces sp. NPDC086766 TaxID=3365754 RepID=UPI003802E75F